MRGMYNFVYVVDVIKMCVEVSWYVSFQLCLNAFLG